MAKTWTKGKWQVFLLAQGVCAFQESISWALQPGRTTP